MAAFSTRVEKYFTFQLSIRSTPQGVFRPSDFTWKVTMQNFVFLNSKVRTPIQDIIIHPVSERVNLQSLKVYNLNFYNFK